LREEAKETSGVTSALLLDYLDRVGGRDVLLTVLCACGLENCEGELRDQNTWFSWETKIALFEATAIVLEKPEFLSEMASYALDAKVAEGLRVALRTLGSPQLVLRNIVRANARFVRSHVLELSELRDGHARLRFSEIGDGRRYHRMDCQYTSGLLAVIPELFGLPAARVSHFQCATDGADACEFELHWTERRRSGSRIAVAGAAAMGMTIASAVVFPPALPWTGSATAAAASAFVHERWRWRREQWQHLQRQADDSDEVAQRLFASLQDLVSDLRFEEVVAKVTRNAQAAVGGREFLLVVREGDRLTCQSCSDLPRSVVSAIEEWANGSPRVLEASLLLDDVSSIAELRQLTELDDPLRSLASATLNSGGAPFGLLVALGGQQQTFLPGDITVLESYAAQVAIALTNARLYHNERTLAARDPLTGLLNHRSFHEALDAELERCRHEDSCASLVLLDLDHFKRVNDEDGHAGGDRLLRAVSQALAAGCRPQDLTFRIGGDEFALLLPGLTERSATEVADRVCSTIAGLDQRIGASSGVVCAGASDTDKDGLLARADRRLYAGKQAGATGLNQRRSPGEPITTQMAIDLLLATARLHHPPTFDHCQAVARLAVCVADRLGSNSRERELIEHAALLHDLGKVAIPQEVLDKTAALTEQEWTVIRRHPDDGADTLQRVPGLAPVAAAVRASHERWDGTGYPRGLAADRIPLAARIIAACDAFHAMTSPRPYCQPRTQSEAIDELQTCSGSQFDPAVTRALVSELSEQADALVSHSRAPLPHKRQHAPV
jgi:diguanylate cyclase (GGDEF)-like protein/putative nucleotidyltransferase with HDIG domain